MDTDDSSTLSEEWLSSLDALREQRSAFVVRIRTMRTVSATARQEWRGTVEHVQSKTVAFFTEWSELNDFIAAHSGIPPPSTWSKRLGANWRASRFAKWLTRYFSKANESNPSSISVS